MIDEEKETFLLSFIETATSFIQTYDFENGSKKVMTCLTKKKIQDLKAKADGLLPGNSFFFFFIRKVQKYDCKAG